MYVMKYILSINIFYSLIDKFYIRSDHPDEVELYPEIVRVETDFSQKDRIVQFICS